MPAAAATAETAAVTYLGTPASDDVRVLALGTCRHAGKRQAGKQHGREERLHLTLAQNRSKGGRSSGGVGGARSAKGVRSERERESARCVKGQQRQQ